MGSVKDLRGGDKELEDKEAGAGEKRETSHKVWCDLTVPWWSLQQHLVLWYPPRSQLQVDEFPSQKQEQKLKQHLDTALLQEAEQ